MWYGLNRCIFNDTVLLRQFTPYLKSLLQAPIISWKSCSVHRGQASTLHRIECTSITGACWTLWNKSWKTTKPTALANTVNWAQTTSEHILHTGKQYIDAEETHGKNLRDTTTRYRSAPTRIARIKSWEVAGLVQSYTLLWEYKMVQLWKKLAVSHTIKQNYHMIQQFP